MKKSLLFFATTVAALSASAQTVIWNGEDKELGSDGGFWYRATPTVVEQDGNKCLKITLAANPGGWDKEHCNAALPLGDVDMKGLRRISMRVKQSKQHNVYVKLVKDGGYNTGRWFWLDDTEGWNLLTFEFGAGPESGNITDTGNTVLEIWPFEDGNDALANIGQTVYIDDIKLEGPTVNGVAVRTMAEGSLTDKQVIVGGSMRKGTYQNTWDGEWHSENFDDYSLLLSKLSPEVCFLNVVDAEIADGDSPQLRQKNPNLMILSATDFFDTDNVIRWDEANRRNNTPKLVLDQAAAFYTPIDFHADEVAVKRSLQAGVNTLCLPFYVGQAEISANCKIATYTSTTATAVNFTYADHADANIPFLATDVDAAVDAETGLSFYDKGVVNTPDNLGSEFVGIYAPQSAQGKYGINADGKFQLGDASATVSSFHALLSSVPASAKGITLIDDATAINTVSAKVDADAVYTLQGIRVSKPQHGLYIINGKKAAIK